MQQSHVKATIDPDLIRFYEAFKNQKSFTKMPIKPSGVNFKRDLDKLKQVSNDMRETMMKVKKEKATSTHRESKFNLVMSDVWEELNKERPGDSTDMQENPWGSIQEKTRNSKRNQSGE